MPSLLLKKIHNSHFCNPRLISSAYVMVYTSSSSTYYNREYASGRRDRQINVGARNARVYWQKKRKMKYTIEEVPRMGTSYFSHHLLCQMCKWMEFWGGGGGGDLFHFRHCMWRRERERERRVVVSRIMAKHAWLLSEAKKKRERERQILGIFCQGASGSLRMETQFCSGKWASNR